MTQDDLLIHLRQESQKKELSRRDFVRALSVASAATPALITAGLTGFSLTSAQRAEAAEAVVAGIGKLPKVKYGSRHGKMMVAPVCFSQDWNSDLFQPGFDLGINFIHKAGYFDDRKPLPELFKTAPRDSFYCDTTVDTTSPGRNPDDEEAAYNQVKTELARTGLKYFDVYRAHYGWHGPKAFNNGDNASYRAFKRLKKEGLVKYFGVSQHPYTDEGGGREQAYEKYVDIIEAEIASGVVDSMQVWFSYGYPKEAMDVFAKASKAGIAMCAMKINAHGRRKMGADTAKMQELKAPGMVGRSLLRWVMSQKRTDSKPIFQTCVTALHNLQLFDENVGGVSTKLALNDNFEQFAF